MDCIQMTCFFSGMWCSRLFYIILTLKYPFTNCLNRSFEYFIPRCFYHHLFNQTFPAYYSQNVAVVLSWPFPFPDYLLNNLSTRMSSISTWVMYHMFWANCLLYFILTLSSLHILQDWLFRVLLCAGLGAAVCCFCFITLDFSFWGIWIDYIIQLIEHGIVQHRSNPIGPQGLCQT